MITHWIRYIFDPGYREYVKFTRERRKLWSERVAASVRKKRR